MDNLTQIYCSQIQGASTKGSEPSERPVPVAVEEAKEEEKAAVANPSEDSKLELSLKY